MGHFGVGKIYFYPTLRENDAVLFTVYFADNHNQKGFVSTNDHVCIKCMEAGMNSKTQNWLGAFGASKDVCYDILSGDETEWIISKKGNGYIQLGDEVKLTNVSYRDKYGFMPYPYGNEQEPFDVLNQTEIDKDDMYFIVTKPFKS
jgi:hypothetical protein